MNSDIRIDLYLPKHPKYKRLKRLLGESPMEYLVCFWCYVASYAPAGNLVGWICEDIEEAAEWRGEKGVFFKAMQDVGFLDETNDGYTPHDWEEHQPWVIKAPERTENAKKAGKASGEARRKKTNERTVERTVEQSVEQTVQQTVQQTVERNANGMRTPSPSPLPKTLTTEEEERGREVNPMAMSDIQKLHVDYLGRIPANQPVASILRDICREYPPDRITIAFQRCAASADKPNLNWIKSYLDNPKNWNKGEANGRGTSDTAGSSTTATKAGRAATGIIPPNSPDTDWVGGSSFAPDPDSS